MQASKRAPHVYYLHSQNFPYNSFRHIFFPTASWLCRRERISTLHKVSNFIVFPNVCNRNAWFARECSWQLEYPPYGEHIYKQCEITDSLGSFFFFWWLPLIQYKCAAWKFAFPSFANCRKRTNDKQREKWRQRKMLAKILFGFCMQMQIGTTETPFAQHLYSVRCVTALCDSGGEVSMGEILLIN